MRSFFLPTLSALGLIITTSAAHALDQTYPPWCVQQITPNLTCNWTHPCLSFNDTTNGTGTSTRFIQYVGHSYSLNGTPFQPQWAIGLAWPNQPMTIVATKDGQPADATPWVGETWTDEPPAHPSATPNNTNECGTGLIRRDRPWSAADKGHWQIHWTVNGFTTNTIEVFVVDPPPSVPAVPKAALFFLGTALTGAGVALRRKRATPRSA